MKLTESNVRKATRKAATIAYLESLPSDHIFAPDSPCGCMYHDLLAAQFDASYIHLTFEQIQIEEKEIDLHARSFATKFQRAACNFLNGRRFPSLPRPRRNGYAAITRDEAIRIAKGITA